MGIRYIARNKATQKFIRPGSNNKKKTNRFVANNGLGLSFIQSSEPW